MWGRLRAGLPVLSGEKSMRKSKLLLVSLVIGVLYLLYSLNYWFGANAGASSGSEAAGVAIASAIVMPHLVCTLVAVVFNALGFFMNKSSFALVAGILYAVALVLFFAYFMFVIVEMVLSFVAYAQMKKVGI